MAFINFQPKDYFNTVLYTGDGSASDRTITGVGFQPDFLWNKSRSNAYNHYIFDVLRGTNMISSNATTAEEDKSPQFSAFTSDGFTIRNDAGSLAINASSVTFANWCWKANGTGSSNTDGSITSTVSDSTTSGFSIVKYTGNGVDNSSIGHGLNSAPEMIILKGYSGAEDWMVYHKGLTAGYEIRLNSNGAESDDGSNATWGDNHPNNINSSTFEVGYAGDSNGSGTDYIAYCFHSVKGFSSMGSYTGNANADGPFIYTGFKPAFIMIKRTDTTGDWLMKDNKRPTVQNPVTSLLYPNQSYAEATGVNDADFLSNGYKIRTTGTAENASGGTYIWMAFAEAPLVSSNGVPNTAR